MTQTHILPQRSATSHYLDRVLIFTIQDALFLIFPCYIIGQMSTYVSPVVAYLQYVLFTTYFLTYSRVLRSFNYSTFCVQVTCTNYNELKPDTSGYTLRTEKHPFILSVSY